MIFERRTTVSKPLEKDINLRKIAERTPGFSGADLANVMNEGAILTARGNRKIITIDDILMSIEKVMLGPERRSRVINDLEKKTVAYHEAGHALVFHELPAADPVAKNFDYRPRPCRRLHLKNANRGPTSTFEGLLSGRPRGLFGWLCC